MKKTLVALAALAATSAFAQSAVVIDGLFDVAYVKVTGDHASYNTTSVNSTAGSATSTINLKVTEDLGGGNTARIQYELDPRKSTTGIDTVPFGLHQQFVALDSKTLGTLKLGNINSAALDAFGAASPLGTATGSGYSYTNTTVGMATRFAKSVKYESPVFFNGFSASYNYAPGNDTTANYLIAQQRKVSDVGLKYSNGPLNVQYSELTSGASTNLVTTTVVPAGVAQSKFKSLGANFAIGDVTLYAGWNKGDAIGAAASTTGLFPMQAIVANTQTKGSRVGAKYVTGAYTLIASSAKQEIDGNTADGTRKVTGLRAENALSKRTSVFVAYEKFDTGIAASGATATAEGGIIKTTAVGVRHTF